jgi:hypothetical protein
MYIVENDSLVLLFFSDPSYLSCNPSWSICGLTPTSLATSSTSLAYCGNDIFNREFNLFEYDSFLFVLLDLIFRINECNPENLRELNGTSLLDFKVNLNTLANLGNVQLSSIESLPLNSFFLFTGRSYYVDNELFNRLKGFGYVFDNNNREINEDDEYDTVNENELRDRVHNSHKAMHLLKCETSATLRDKGHFIIDNALLQTKQIEMDKVIYYRLIMLMYFFNYKNIINICSFNISIIRTYVHKVAC